MTNKSSIKKLSVVYRDIGSLTPYGRNSRTHSDDQVAQIAASIIEYGFTNPILIDERNGIIAGHGRVLAAAALGIQQVPTITLAGLTDSQRRAYIIADNKMALNAGWDIEVLRSELDELGDLGFDLDLTGFSGDEIAGLRPKKLPGTTEPDDAPGLPTAPVSRQGDVWLCGSHRVMCGDSTRLDQVEALMMGAKADMLLTDPPYNVAYEGKTKKKLKIGNDSMGDDAFRQFLRDAFSTADACMKPGAVFYIWHADKEVYNFGGACKDVAWGIRQCLVWRKNSMVLGRQDYQGMHEPCLYGWKSGAGHLWASDRKQVTVLDFDRPSRSESHPTMKPVALFEYLMLNNTKGSDVVLDLFGGSGTTLIAAEMNGRVARLMELDPGYADVCVTRWQEFTGQTARLESTGVAFGG